MMMMITGVIDEDEKPSTPSFGEGYVIFLIESVIRIFFNTMRVNFHSIKWVFIKPFERS